MDSSTKKMVWAGIVIIVVLLLGWFVWSGVQNGTFGIMGSATTTPGAATSTDSKKPVVTKRSSDVATIAASISGASTFASLFSQTGVKATITGAGPYTIFVPTDGSISQLPAGTITNLSAAEKKRLVQYHIIKGRAVDIAAVEAGVITSLSGDVLNFTVSDIDETARVNSAFVVQSYQGTNGMVYLIDTALIPPVPATSNN